MQSEDYVYVVVRFDISVCIICFSLCIFIKKKNKKKTLQTVKAIGKDSTLVFEIIVLLNPKNRKRKKNFFFQFRISKGIIKMTFNLFFISILYCLFHFYSITSLNIRYFHPSNLVVQ